MKKPNTTFSQDVRKLFLDVKSRGKNGVIVALLTITTLGYFMIIEKVLAYRFGWIFSVFAFLAIWLISNIIRKDSIKNLNYSKQACYSVIIIGSAWVTSFVYFIIAKEPFVRSSFQRASDGSINGAELYLSPLFFMSAIALCVLVSGTIAYFVGKRRKDIKGIKKEDLFR